MKIESIQQFKEIRSDLIEKNDFTCHPKRFSESKQWGLNNGAICRRDGAFFSIVGIEGYTLKSFTTTLEQPIIYQPTNAINSFLTKKTISGLEILFQARVEPGNVGVVQLAPTVQSTEANIKQVHGGRPTKYIDCFRGNSVGEILYQGLHSEEGSRYHGKYNLNIISRVDCLDLDKDETNFYFLDSEQIKEFIGLNFVINTDARALLFFLDWNLLSSGYKAFSDNHSPVNQALLKSYNYCGEDVGTDVFDVIKKVENKRANIALRTKHKSLRELENWLLDDERLSEISPLLGFSVSLYEVTAHLREVGRWDQPLVSSDSDGRIILFGRINNGVMEFFVSEDREVGYLESIQLTASVSIAPGKSMKELSLDEQNLLEIADDPSKSEVIIDSYQSEEGGRFFKDINRYQIVLCEERFELEHDSNYYWLTLSQLRKLGSLSSYVAIELRCVISLLIKLI